MPFETYETPFISYAQAREDVVLVRSLRDIVPEEGFYIDIGAYHPHFDSVTKAFYDAGWHGINVEPSPELMAPFLTDRPRDINLQVAVSSGPGELTFFDNENGQLGTLEARYADADWRQRSVVASTLKQICEEHAPAEIHFLKIDVEGHERDVLEGMDFERFRPWIMIIEAVVPNTHIPTFQEWEHIVVAAGYRFVLADAINRFYLAEEHADLIRNFAQVADNFYQSRERWNWEAAQRRVDELQAEVASLQESSATAARYEIEAHALRTEVDALKAAQAASPSRERQKHMFAKLFGR